MFTGSHPATRVTQQILGSAESAGLRPWLSAGSRPGSYRVMVDAGGRDGLFGCIDIGARTGRILRAYLTHGNHGTERRYETVAEIRTVIQSWAAVSRQKA
jgi:hypothetical protein